VLLEIHIVSGRTCPECRHAAIDSDGDCRHCGFKLIPTTELREAFLIYCDKCACHFVQEVGATRACRVHDEKDQRKADWVKV
jgi:hypothetical protein